MVVLLGDVCFPVEFVHKAITGTVFVVHARRMPFSTRLMQTKTFLNLTSELLCSLTAVTSAGTDSVP